jgi:hypothetical protein
VVLRSCHQTCRGLTHFVEGSRSGALPGWVVQAEFRGKPEKGQVFSGAKVTISGNGETPGKIWLTSSAWLWLWTELGDRETES